MAANGLPPLDLAGVLFPHSPAEIVPAVPLEPAARVIGMDPPFPAPFRERLAGIDLEIVERWIAPPVGELGTLKPALRILAPAIGHVLAAEDSHAKHLPRREFGAELWI